MPGNLDVSLLGALQVAFADKILLNKLDLVTDEEKARVISRIKVGAPLCMLAPGRSDLPDMMA